MVHVTLTDPLALHASAAARLGLALGVSAVLWALVWWALRA